MIQTFKGFIKPGSKEESLLGQIESDRLPEHVAIIMDGNGRWAKRRNQEHIAGHQEGGATAREITECSARLGIKHLTLFTFSSENWKRPKKEVNTLMNMLYENLLKRAKLLFENDIRLKVIGDIEALPERLQMKLRETEEKTESHQQMQVNLALNYGSRLEIVQAVKRLMAEGVSAERIDEEMFGGYLYTKQIPDPDFLIRTSGEYRLSNFLLYQIAYSELFFSPILWPDFKTGPFLEALLDYSGRTRRFGGR